MSADGDDSFLIVKNDVTSMAYYSIKYACSYKRLEIRKTHQVSGSFF